MIASLLDVGTIVNNGNHNAFTDVTQWRNNYYVAYRKSMTHGITPKGSLVVHTCDTAYESPGNITNPDAWLQYSDDITHPIADLRDPRLIPTKDALWLLCGAYFPCPTHTDFHGLSAHSSDNLIFTLLTYTTDGLTWAPLTKILAPQHWGWSVLKTPTSYVLTAYVTGLASNPSSVALWHGKSLFNLTYQGTIYEGGSTDLEGKRYRFPSISPSEMVLYQPSKDTIACLLRTTEKMNIGVTHHQTNDWRWTICDQEILPGDDGTPEWFAIDDILHPSSIIHTPYGWLVAVRRCKPVYSSTAVKRISKTQIDHYAYSTALYEVRGQYVTRLLTLPSGGDCGYAGLVPWNTPDEYLCSYYSQDAYDRKGEFGTTMPAADIKIAHVRITA